MHLSGFRGKYRLPEKKVREGMLLMVGITVQRKPTSRLFCLAEEEVETNKEE